MTALLCLSAICLAAVVSQSPPKDYAPSDWLVVGPFPNDPLTKPTVEGVTRAGFDKDFLGGEAAFVAKPASKIGSATTKTVKANPGELVDFAPLYTKTDNMVAYAYGVILSDKEQVLQASFGSDDAAKVWVNGKLVHRFWSPGRGFDPTSDHFEVPVKKGENPVLVKVENVSGGWGFGLSLMDAAGLKAKEWQRVARDIADREIVAIGNPGYLLTTPQFPRLGWRDWPLIEPLVSSEPMKVRWFDADANEVKTADRMGPYAAYIETATAADKPIRRLLFFCRVEPEVVDAVWGLDTTVGLPIGTDSLPLPIPTSVLQSKKPAIEQYLAMAAADLAFRSEGASYLAGYLSQDDVPAVARPLDLGVYGMRYLIKVRQKIKGLETKGLKPFEKVDKPAPTIRYGSEAEAGIKTGTAEKLKKMLADWSREEGKPFSALIARKGVVFLHEGYGVDKNETFYPASIGKTFFGLVFAQFVDQGLINPDDPIGKYLPDFPTSGPQAVTFRNCVTHTSGTAGHRTYGGLWNPTLDNAFSQWLPTLNPGIRFAYGGDGNNLAAKALELISGVPMAQMLRDRLFDPLDAGGIIEPDLGYSSEARPWDVAKIAQLMANRGVYGDTRFLSEEGFKRFLPTKLSQYMPNLGDKNLEWGFANEYMEDPDGPRETSQLGPNVIGHGSASSSILRVDLDSGIIVVMGRYGVGDNAKHQEYRGKVMRLLRESIVR